MCSAAKVRCSGTEPCTRCHRRDHDCIYPDESAHSKRRRQRPPADPSSSLQINTGPLLPIFDNALSSPIESDLHAFSASSGQWAHGYDQDIWEPGILAMTNWLNSTVSNGDGGMQIDTLALQPFDVSTFPPLSQVDEFGDRSDRAPSSADTNQRALSDNVQSVASGEFYVDGYHTRQPKMRRRVNISSPQGSGFPPIAHTNAFSLEEPTFRPHARASSVSVDANHYESLVTTYCRLCLGHFDGSTPFLQAPFISKNCLDTLICLALDHSSTVLPFLHTSYFQLSDMHWIEVLALASFGAHYLESTCRPQFTSSLHEFQRRVMRSFKYGVWPEHEFEPHQKYTAILLYLVGARYGGDMASFESAYDARTAISDIFSQALRKAVATSTHQLEVEDLASWRSWRDRERYIRLAYFAWQLDCMGAYQHDSRPLLALSDATIPLPCPERLWLAPTPEAWVAAGQEQPTLLSPPPTLLAAVQEIYVDKRLRREQGDFARVLIIHAILHRSWEVERYFSNPISQWEPVALRQDSSKLLQKRVWLPGVPMYIRWQNSTCDALDILHWQENVATAQATGSETPIVLHLHLARLICLTPYGQIVSLARRLAEDENGKFQASDDIGMTLEIDAIRRWAVAHPYKARLSVVHAGALLWHVRRYSVCAFYEAPAVALATLTLWAFGVFSKASTPQHDQMIDRLASETQRRNTEHAEDLCEIVLLDRPIDDELVQHFVRSGDSMEARLSGIGNLYERKAPGLVLLEGGKILMEAEEAWLIAAVWRKLLNRLGALWENQRSAVETVCQSTGVA